ncbi:MAG TPA: hypothetical protein VMU50_09575 [Polyangia bacterium]|nr:hypothetical protein [Polyangia bacterium]
MMGSTGGTTGTGGAGGQGGTGGTGGSGAAGSDGGSAGADGGMNCSPACDTISICVGTGTEGGAIIVANDAGVCPAGSHPAGISNICARDLSFACKPIPAACGATVTCACASSLCPTSYHCGGPSDGVLTCVLQVP